MAEMFFGRTGPIRIPYVYVCQNCGSRQTGTQLLSGANEAALSAESAQRKAARSLHATWLRVRSLSDRDDYSWLSAQPCPVCGHLQSWQVKASESQRKYNSRYMVGTLVALIILDLLCISTFVFSSPKPVVWAFLALLLLGTGLLIWGFRRRGKAPPVARQHTSLRPEINWPVI